MTIEQRNAVFEGLEVRAMHDDEDGKRVIRGLAVPWESLSVPLFRDYKTGKMVRERFERGAFSAVLANGADVVALRDHDRGRLLGRISSGTLRVWESERGLEYEVELPDTTDGRDVYELVRRTDVRGSSFAFLPSKDGERYEEHDDEIIWVHRTVAELRDVSPVTDPAYPESQVETRSLQEALDELRARSEPRDESWRAAAEAREREIGLAEIA